LQIQEVFISYFGFLSFTTIDILSWLCRLGFWC